MAKKMFLNRERVISAAQVPSVMPLGKVYYDPKHAAGFGSVERWSRQEHLHFAQASTKKFPS